MSNWELAKNADADTQIFSIDTLRLNKEKTAYKNKYTDYLRNLSSSEMTYEVNQLVQDVQNSVVEEKHALHAELIMNELALRCVTPQSEYITNLRDDFLDYYSKNKE